MTLNMPRLTVGFGISLVLIGLTFYLVSGRSSLTALIPAAFGIVLVLLGIVAERAASPKHAMHMAVVVALLGIAGSLNGFPAFFRMLGGDSVERPLAAAAKVAMAVDLVAYLVCCIKSFIAARRARKADAAGTADS